MQSLSRCSVLRAGCELRNSVQFHLKFSSLFHLKPNPVPHGALCCSSPSPPHTSLLFPFKIFISSSDRGQGFPICTHTLKYLEITVSVHLRAELDSKELLKSREVFTRSLLPLLSCPLSCWGLRVSCKRASEKGKGCFDSDTTSYILLTTLRSHVNGFTTSHQSKQEKNPNLLKAPLFNFQITSGVK